jgi:hypothetical protein
MLQLGYTTSGVRAIKFGHIHPWKEYVALKVMVLQGMGMRGMVTFSMWG